MKDVFAYIRRTPTREYLLRCSYLEIYNESIHDLLAPPGSASTSQSVQIIGNGILSPLREEVVTSLKSVKEVLERGDGNRRTASTDWNERSSRSHSVFRLVIESRERRGVGKRSCASDAEWEVYACCVLVRVDPGCKPEAGGACRLRFWWVFFDVFLFCVLLLIFGVQSLIDLAGSERATSDKERTREGKYINTSLLTLGTVIGTLAENAAKNKAYVPPPLVACPQCRF
jgi:centromeric protein E